MMSCCFLTSSKPSGFSKCTGHWRGVVSCDSFKLNFRLWDSFDKGMLALFFCPNGEPVFEAASFAQTAVGNGSGWKAREGAVRVVTSRE
jgi:hypothetical protein